MRLNLNYDWKFLPQFDEEYLQENFKDDNFETVNIPHTVKEVPYNNFDEKIYQFVSCYRKSFDIPKSYDGKRLILEFEAVASYAQVYVNGKFAFEHKGGYTAFSGDITEFAKIGASNLVVVKVDSTERPEIPPFGRVIDYLVYGGIYREVYLYAKNDKYIKHIEISFANVLKAPELLVKLHLNEESDTPAYVRVLDCNGKLVDSYTMKSNNNRNGLVALQHKMSAKVELWDIDKPTLYTLEVDYAGDVYTEKFGFREATFTKNGFYLNGKPLKIRGLNRHQSYPYVGYAMPKQAQIDDADFLKYDLGLNLARTAHYPNSKHFLNRCDEIGLLVFTEIPGWQFVSESEEWRNLCLQHVEEMIVENYNHPSIILWGVRINESDDCHDLYAKTNELAHKLDPSRQTGGVRCFPQSELLEDVYTFNDFTHSGNNMALMPKIIVTGLSKPLLITEYGGHMFPTKSFDIEKTRQENAIRHARVLNRAYARKNTCGAIGWCMSDYNTHKDFGSGDKICYHGVSDMFRMNKLSAYVYKSQQDNYPVLEVSSNMEIGDNAGGKVGDVYMFTNCDTVKLYKNGLHINTFNIAELAKKSMFKALPHPPIILHDIIGNQLDKIKTFKGNKRDIELIKNFLLDIKKYGTLGSVFRHLFIILKLLLKYKQGIGDITMLFGQFVQGWGDESVEYLFEGIKGNKTMKISKSSVKESHLSANAGKTQLVEGDTYDTCRIELRALSQTNTPLVYSNDVVNISCSDNLTIIGETSVALIGGQRAVWIKTNGKSGDGYVNIESSIGNSHITFNITKLPINE